MQGVLKPRGQGPRNALGSPFRIETPQNIPASTRSVETSDYIYLSRRSYEEVREKAVVARRTLRTTAWASAFPMKYSARRCEFSDRSCATGLSSRASSSEHLRSPPDLGGTARDLRTHGEELCCVELLIGSKKQAAYVPLPYPELPCQQR